MSFLLVLLFLLALLGLMTGIFKPLSVPLVRRKSQGHIFKFYGAAANWSVVRNVFMTLALTLGFTLKNVVVGLW